MARPTPGAGELRERVTVQRVLNGRDEMGGLVESWQSVAALWAKVEPMSAGEQYRRQQIQASADWKVTIRYRGDLTAADRIGWRGHTFEIASVTNPDTRRQFMELACRELRATVTQVGG